MQDCSDIQLLARYAQRRDESAFREIIRRHTDFVYSAALRQTNSPDQARDVTQTVYTDLARKAPILSKKLTPESSLAGWLYRSTRFAALKSLRANRRRLACEKKAMEYFATITEPPPDWESLRPLLDEMMSGLSVEDRDALLLRFFKDHDLQSVGRALGISDDAAQKRITRALEKLRRQLSRRGIETSAAALSLMITANAIQAAPAGLVSTISSAALLPTAGLSTGFTSTKILTMTALQKTLVTSAIVVAVSAGIFEGSRAARLQTAVESLKRERAPLAGQVAQLSKSRDDASNLLAMAREENDRLRLEVADLPKLRGRIAKLEDDSRQLDRLKNTLAEDKTLNSVVSWKQRVEQLKAKLEQTPEAQIPELQLVTEDDWLNAARGKLESDIDYRKALSALRNAGEKKVVTMLQKLLKNYLKQNDNTFPADLSQLQFYFDSKIDDALLRRWEIAPASTIKSLGLGGNFLITERSAVDDVFDLRYAVGPSGLGTTDFLSSETRDIVGPMWMAFAKEHNGREAEDIAQLMPYATTPEQRNALQKMALKQNSESK